MIPRSLVALQYSYTSIEPGAAILLIGVFGLLAWLSVVFRNPMALVMWGISLIMFILSTVLDFGSEFVWIGLSLTSILVIIGIGVRSSQ